MRPASSRILMSFGVADTMDMPSSLFSANVSRGVRIGVCPGRPGVAPTPPALRGVAIGFGVAAVCFLGAMPSKPVEAAPSCSGVFSPRSADLVSLRALIFRISLAM